MAASRPNHVDHFRTDTLLVRTYHAEREAAEAPSPESEAPFSSVVLPVSGGFVKHIRGRTIVADTNRAIFFRRGEVYFTSHPQGRRLILEIGIDDGVMHSVLMDAAPHRADRDEAFPTHALADDRVCLARHLLVRRLAAPTADRDVLDTLEIEEAALGITRHVMESAPDPRAPRGRAATRRAHAELAEAAAAYLVGHFDEPLELADIARAVHASPFHLSRVFRAECGRTLHRYLTDLRLRATLERLADDPRDLTRIALDAGFCSHSHFTRAFRSAFHATPSVIRAAGPEALRDALHRLGAEDLTDGTGSDARDLVA